MSDDLRKQIYLNFNHRETEELLEIWRAHDCNEWSNTTFDVIQEILQSRGVEPSKQDQPVYETTAHQKTRRSEPATVRRSQSKQHSEPPPQKVVARPANSRGVESPRPQTIIYAVYLGAGGLAIQAVLAVVNLVTGQFSSPAVDPQFAVFMALGMVGLVALEAALLYGAWLGRNGPRVFYIGLTLFSVLSTLINGAWTESWSVQPLRTSVYILATCLELIAVTLLVLPHSNVWFRNIRAARPVDGQATQKKKRDPQRRRSPTWLSELSPDRWVKRYTFGTLALSFIIGLFASWLIYSLVLWLQDPRFLFDSFLNSIYAISCLPAQAVALILGAVIGAVRTQPPEARYRRATHGVWVVTLLAIAAAILGAGIIPNANW